MHLRHLKTRRTVKCSKRECKKHHHSYYSDTHNIIGKRYMHHNYNICLPTQVVNYFYNIQHEA